jgi:hypothetical protein
MGNRTLEGRGGAGRIASDSARQDAGQTKIARGGTSQTGRCHVPAKRTKAMPGDYAAKAAKIANRIAPR